MKYLLFIMLLIGCGKEAATEQAAQVAAQPKDVPITSDSNTAISEIASGMESYDAGIFNGDSA
jgi:hypothetical protein